MLKADHLKLLKTTRTPRSWKQLGVLQFLRTGGYLTPSAASLIIPGGSVNLERTVWPAGVFGSIGRAEFSVYPEAKTLWNGSQPYLDITVQTPAYGSGAHSGVSSDSARYGCEMI